MASLQSFFTTFISLFVLLILLHLGCFFFTTNYQHHPPINKRRKIKLKAVSSSSWSYLKRIFTKLNHNNNKTHPNTPNAGLCSSARSSQRSLTSPLQPELLVSLPRKRTTGSVQESDISLQNPFLPLRNDIFPCPACGEVFHKPQILEQHQSIKHAVTELVEGDSGKNIVQIIFKTGWTDKNRNPKIERILKIHNSPKILARFEEYRELVKLKAARNSVVKRRDERCIADGNELLRFHCSTFLCDLGRHSNSSLCNQQYCSVCGIIRSGFSPKVDGISTLSSSWRAHVAIPDDVEEEFAFMNVKRAMLVCRVVAGRISCDQEAGKDEPAFDSVVGSRNGAHMRLDEEELLVFNQKAVLPCFVIVYTV